MLAPKRKKALKPSKAPQSTTSPSPGTTRVAIEERRIESLITVQLMDA